jgi:hypothetical protein
MASSVATTPILAIMVDLIRNCGLARRSRLVPSAVAPEPRPPLCFRAFASVSHRWRWPGWRNYWTPGWRWRFSPAPGHACSRRDRAAGCLLDWRWSRSFLAGCPQDSCLVINWACSYAGPGGKSSISAGDHGVGSRARSWSEAVGVELLSRARSPRHEHRDPPPRPNYRDIGSGVWLWPVPR